MTPSWWFMQVGGHALLAGAALFEVGLASVNLAGRFEGSDSFPILTRSSIAAPCVLPTAPYQAQDPLTCRVLLK